MSQRLKDPPRSIGAPTADRPSSRPWWERANCRGMNPDVFFPPRGTPTADARDVCKRCLVRRDCLEDALAAGDIPGIWGGRSARQRRMILRQRRASEPYRESA